MSEEKLVLLQNLTGRSDDNSDLEIIRQRQKELRDDDSLESECVYLRLDSSPSSALLMRNSKSVFGKKRKIESFELNPTVESDFMTEGPPWKGSEYDITFKFEQTQAVTRWKLASCKLENDRRFYLFKKNNREYDKEKRSVFGGIKTARIEVCSFTETASHLFIRQLAFACFERCLIITVALSLVAKFLLLTRKRH